MLCIIKMLTRLFFKEIRLKNKLKISIVTSLILVILGLVAYAGLKIYTIYETDKNGNSKLSSSLSDGKSVSGGLDSTANAANASSKVNYSIKASSGLEISQLTNQGDDINVSLSFTQDSYYPSYYKEEIEKTAKTIAANDSDDAVKYIFATDFHYDISGVTTDIMERTAHSIVDLANNCDIDFVVIGGDIYNGQVDEGRVEAMRRLNAFSTILEACKVPVFIVEGNHDDNSQAYGSPTKYLEMNELWLTPDDWYQSTMAHFSTGIKDYKDGYYYYDFPDKDLRVVVLNMDNVDDNLNPMGKMNTWGYSDEQVDWLLNKALARDNCRYMIFSHDGFAKMWHSSYQTGIDGTNADTIEAIMTAAASHSKFSLNGFYKDFSSLNTRLEVFSAGHFHMTRETFEEGNNYMPYFNTECVKFNENAEYYRNSLGFDNAGKRTYNTASETVYDVVISKPSASEFDILRFGNGYDKLIKY